MRTCRALALAIVLLGAASRPSGAVIQDPKAPAPKPVTDGRSHDPHLIAALVWLARHQDVEGGWTVRDYKSACEASPCDKREKLGTREFDIGVTALALLAFLKAGYAPGCDDVYQGQAFGKSVDRGLEWLVSRQTAGGALMTRDQTKVMYNHAIGTAALCEAVRAGAQNFEPPARRAVTWLHDARNPGRVWRYMARDGENDTSVTGWVMIALRAAKDAKLGHDEEAWRDVKEWFHHVTNDTYYRVGYDKRDSGKVFIRGVDGNEPFHHHETMSAIGALFRLHAGEKKESAPIWSPCSLLLNDLPEWQPASIDYNYWYHGTALMLQVEKKTGKQAAAWLKALTPVLEKNQRDAKAGCARGSWDPVDRWSCEAGRVYGTAMNALTLTHIVPPAKPRPKPPAPAPPK
jgi:hypothetical protein